MTMRKLLCNMDDMQFVECIYARYLGRSVERDAAISAVSALMTGKITRKEFVRSIILSDEAKSYRCRKEPTVPDVLSVEELIQLDGEDFVETSCRMLLGEGLEEEKVKNAVEMIESGFITKETFLQGVSETEKSHQFGAVLSDSPIDELIENERERLVNNFFSFLNYEEKISNKQIQQLQKTVKSLISNMLTLQSDLATVHESGDTAKEINVKYEIGTSKPRTEEYYAIDYFDFENHFRGSFEQIKKNQRIYLPYFEGKNNVLDLGCGRGEFTELLVENGVGVTGVDMYKPYVEFVQEKGLPCVLDDAIDYLKKCENVDGIFLGQVVEHLTVNQIIELLTIAYDKLEVGSYMIMETPNPRSLAIYSNAFYMDPSHNKPVHPLTLQYLAEKAGFVHSEIVYPESSRDNITIPVISHGGSDVSEFNRSMNSVSDRLFGAQDYALIVQR